MFNIGGYVSYRSEGVCIITDIRCESFGSIGKDEKYYILSPLNDPKSTVYVPASNEKLMSMMRKLLSAEEIENMVSELREKRLEWISDNRLRNSRFKEILLIGDRRELILVANTLAEKLAEQEKTGIKLPQTDINTLKRAITLLYNEFSATTDISSSEDLIGVLNGNIRLNPKNPL